MRDGLVTRPFDAYLHLDGAERRLEVGETVSAAELSQWGRSVDHLVNTGRLALITEVTSAEASIETLVHAVVDRAEELTGAALEKLQELLPQIETDEEQLFETIRERADEFAAELAAHGINLLEHSSDEDLLTEVGQRGLSPEAAEAEGDGANGVGGDLGGIGDGLSGSPPSAGDPTPDVEPDPEGEHVADGQPVEETAPPEA